MSYERLVENIRGSLFETAVVCTALALLFMIMEPVITQGASDTDEFTVTQTITGAIAFAEPTADITMDGTIDGLTGGEAHGTTTVRVTTNNSSGYNLTISFSSTTAMIRNGAENNAEILNYPTASNTADYASGFDSSAGFAQIGFTVNASNTTEVSDVFTSTTGTCGTNNNGGFVAYACWQGASSTDAAATTELINSSTQTSSSGSTSTIMFKVAVPPNPTPAVPNGDYVATATLTATDN